MKLDKVIEFPTNLNDIKARISEIEPVQYAITRNFGNGKVTFLGPYISRGVISTRQVCKHIMDSGPGWEKAEKLIQELAWRDYWQQVWIAKEDDIHRDLKKQQSGVGNHEIPVAVLDAKTGIQAVDQAINELYATGYMHNHMRMYVASICCNIAGSHWLLPSRWMYAQLLDGDLASNQLSWQWVAGSFSSKKYYANQDNINKFFDGSQKDSFLDVDYESFSELDTPKVLMETELFNLETMLPKIEKPFVDSDKTTLIYNYYNVDPDWYQGQNYQRILLLEPSLFKKYPVNKRCIDFVLALAENIPDIKLYVGEFQELEEQLSPLQIKYKEHPLNNHYRGQQEPREWMSSVTGYFPSFFAFWKQCKKELKR